MFYADLRPWGELEVEVEAIKKWGLLTQSPSSVHLNLPLAGKKKTEQTKKRTDTLASWKGF